MLFHLEMKIVMMTQFELGTIFFLFTVRQLIHGGAVHDKVVRLQRNIILHGGIQRSGWKKGIK